MTLSLPIRGMLIKFTTDDNQTDDVSRTGARGYGDERVENHEERVVYVQVLTPRLAATPTTPQSIEL